MLKRRSTLVLFGGAVVICAALLLWCGPGAAQSEQLAPASADLPSNEPAVLSRSDPHDAMRGPLRVFDKLLGVELDESATITPRASEGMVITPGTVVDLSTFLSEASIALVEGTGIESPSVTLEESTQWTGDAWHCTLPYNAGLSVTITGTPIGEDLPRSEFYLLPHPATMSVEEMSVGTVGPFVLDMAGMTLAGKVKWLFKKGALKPVYHGTAEQSASLEFYEPLAGDFVVLWVDHLGNQAFGEVTLVRGERSELDLLYQPRPVLEGRLLDWHGAPVPNERIKVIVSLDLSNYDYMPMDPHAFGAIRTDAEGWFHTIQLSYTTDSDGEFSCTTPKGSEYAIQSFALGSYAFWSSMDSGVYPADGVKLELHLLNPELAQRRIWVTSAQGGTLDGAEVLFGLVDDLPFMRSWPRQKADVGGVVSFAGLESGQLATFFVKHASLKSGVYAERLRIPESGDIQILLPLSALRAP